MMGPATIPEPNIKTFFMLLLFNFLVYCCYLILTITAVFKFDFYRKGLWVFRPAP
jgi:NADH:ubiquinone oxidoreductase subunit B-like Fe-S oxidoreductase